MFLSDISIRRPVFATMLNVVLVVFGLFSLPRLAIDQYPDIDFPVVTVTVVYPGADPESVEQRVLKPLEDAVNGISGLDKLNSTAYPGLAQLILTFKLEKKVDQAAQETRDKVFAAVNDLPPEVKTPLIQKLDIGGAPVLGVAMTGEGIDFGELSQIAKDRVMTALERVPGVAEVQTAGIRPREVQVYVNRNRLSSFNLTPADIIASIQEENLDVPAGKLQNDTDYSTLRVKNRRKNGPEIAALPIIGSTQSGLLISDVADVKDQIAEEENASFVDHSPTILFNLLKQAGTSTTTVAEDSKLAVEKLSKQLPPGIKLEVVTDNSRYIKGSIESVEMDLVLGAVLASFIVFLFLRDWRITLIASVALPTAVIATFAFLDSMHFTLNMMSTLGLSLSIGILIDDAIIVIENIARHLAMGKSGEQAAKDATEEIGMAVFATTLTICAVFVPVAFMRGIIGRFFYQFGLTVACAVAISLFVAFTLTPMLSSRLLKPHHVGGSKKSVIDRFLDSIDRVYKAILVWCLENRWKTIGMGFVILIISFVMVRFVPVAFFPKEDKSEFNVNYTLKEGTTIEETKRQSLRMVDAIKAYPGVKRIITAVASGADKKLNKSVLDVQLVGKEARNFTQFQFMDRMRGEIVKQFAVDGAEVDVSEVGGAGGGRAQNIQYIFKSDNYADLVAFTDKMFKWMHESLPGAVDISTTKAKPQNEFRIVVDPLRAADMGVSVGQVGTIVRALFEGDKISEIDDKGTSFDVRLRISDKDRISDSDLAGVTIMSRHGQTVTLGSVANIVRSTAPSAVDRFDGQRQITMLANFTGKDFRGATTALEDYANKNMPKDMTWSASGQADVMKDAISAILQALLLAILLVFMILCAQYESYLAPLVIMAALPLSFAGAFGSLLLTGQVMSVFTMIGIILLMGIVTKNGILLIDFTMQRIREGETVKQALLEAGPIRLRPILMTTFAAGGGMIPIALGHGEGGEARSPMGVAVIGGLLMSTMLTLVVVPCAFSLVEQFRAWMRRVLNRRKPKSDQGAHGMPVRNVVAAGKSH